jgi:hypothetical protein
LMTMPSNWELTILDADTPSNELGSITAGDIDGDGNIEILAGGNQGLVWYRPATRQRGVVARMHCHVGIALEDVDGDGKLEAVLGEAGPNLYWFKPPKNLENPWTRHVIDAATLGAPHDVVFGDIDGDGKRELVVDAVYSPTPGIYAYKPGADPTKPWRKCEISSGLALEGTAIADLDGDGQMEIICGPDYFKRPVAGTFSGRWTRHTFAPSHREMCRVKPIDITGNGRPDLVIVDSEYMDGKLSWFENRMKENPAEPWVEHELEIDLIYAHSLSAWRDGQRLVRIMVGEMPKGGWGAPVNHKARIIEFTSRDQGKSWQQELLSHGEGTHEGMAYDIDNDGELEIIGKDPFEWPYDKPVNSRVHFWKRAKKRSPILDYRHRFLDRDKPHLATDIFTADLDGDGKQEIITGHWWYRLDTGARAEIPGICQALCAYDIDGDGKPELIGMKLRHQQKGPLDQKAAYEQLSNEMVWLKPIDLASGKWKEYVIGNGHGDWSHGTLIAPLLPGGKLAMVTGWHDAIDKGNRPEIWQIPADPTKPWKPRILADIPYGEEFVASDIDGNGKLDLVAGSWWLENRGDGTFQPHRICEGFSAARVAVADINGDGRPDVILGEEVLDFQKRIAPRSSLVWFENSGDPRNGFWKKHVIDKVRCAHSIAAADLDGDGEPEIICGEHDPFWPYRNMCNMYVYKKADPKGLAWKRYCLDSRFEHHDGTKIIDLGGGKKGIVSHGWTDSIYVNLWEPR